MNEVAQFAALRTIVKEFPEIPADPRTTLLVILNGLSSRLREEFKVEIRFSINMRAFDAEGLINEEKMLDFSPVSDRPLRKEVNISTAAYLSHILDRLSEKGPVASGATFIIRKESVEITTNQALRTQIWGGHPGPYLPLVYAAFQKRPLEQALDELAEQTEHNIVLDLRAGEKAKTAVTAHLSNTPLDTAVSLLAEMADLQPVLQDNVIFVTTPEHAARLQARQKKENAIEFDGKSPSGPRIGSGVRNFVPLTGDGKR
jgi:hypothetical protein